MQAFDLGIVKRKHLELLSIFKLHLQLFSSYWLRFCIDTEFTFCFSSATSSSHYFFFYKFFYFIVFLLTAAFLNLDSIWQLIKSLRSATLLTLPSNVLFKRLAVLLVGSLVLLLLLRLESHWSLRRIRALNLRYHFWWSLLLKHVEFGLKKNSWDLILYFFHQTPLF